MVLIELLLLLVEDLQDDLCNPMELVHDRPLQILGNQLNPKTYESSGISANNLD